MADSSNAADMSNMNSYNNFNNNNNTTAEPIFDLLSKIDEGSEYIGI